MAGELEFYSLRDAYNQTVQPMGRRVYASSANVHQLAQFLFFIPIIDNSGALDYRRRAHGDFINIPYSIPGSSINRAPDARVVSVRTELHEITAQPSIASSVQLNYANAPYMVSNPLSPMPMQKDPLWTKAEMLMQDMARTAWSTAISGKWIDLCQIKPGGSLTAAEITNIEVGHSVNYIRGTGFLRFTRATMTLEFKAPGDNIYGPAVVVANANTYTLRAGATGGYIKVTTGVLPVSDGLCEIEFSSTSNRPDGLIALMEPDQIRSLPVPTRILPKYLDELLTMLFPAYRDSMWTVFIMHPRDLNALKEVARSMNTQLDHDDFASLMAPVDPDILPIAKKKLPTYDGHAILVDDTLPIKMMDGKQTRPILAVCLDPRQPESDNVDFGAFVGVLRGPVQGAIYRQYGFGWYIENLGASQQATVHMMRVCLNHAWALGSSGAAAMIEGFFSDIF